MREELNRHCKCLCTPRSADRWVVVREQGITCVILCEGCKQAWHTAARYASDLPRDIASPYRWRQILRSQGYHMRESDESYLEIPQDSDQPR